MKYKRRRSTFSSFKRTLKLLDVVAEEEAQYFRENPVDIGEEIVELLDPIVSVTFDRVILLQDKALVQGTINKNVIYKDCGDDIEYFEEDPIQFGIDVKLSGLTPGFTHGKFNRAVITNNVINIGPDNQGTNGGIDIQIYLTRLFTFQRIIDATSGTIDQKIVLDFIIKVSKYIQQDIEFPAPQAVFECRNVKPCNGFIRPVHHDDGPC